VNGTYAPGYAQALVAEFIAGPMPSDDEAAQASQMAGAILSRALMAASGVELFGANDARLTVQPDGPNFRLTYDSMAG
jgi:hypothetical protein